MGTFTAVKKKPDIATIFDNSEWKSIEAGKAVYLDIKKYYVKDVVYLAKNGIEELRLAMKLSNNLIVFTNYRFVMVEVKNLPKFSITHKSFLWSNLCYFKITTNEVDENSDSRTLLLKFKGYEQPIIIPLGDNYDTHTLLEFLSTAHISFQEQRFNF